MVIQAKGLLAVEGTNAPTILRIKAIAAYSSINMNTVSGSRKFYEYTIARTPTRKLRALGSTSKQRGGGK